MQEGKLIIFSAPSGSGKTTLVRHLLSVMPDKLQFSISATSRPKRGVELNGKDYHYLTVDEFKEKIKNNEFLEWEEVYAGTHYGTLRSEVERIWKEGKNVIFDIDVQGGLNLKHQFGDKALAVFVMPPSIKILEQRLNSRQTDSPESIALRVEKAEQELQTAKLFDCFILNEHLETAFKECERVVSEFLSKK
ncbi:MAG TPA: guanylate kinase [Bacteroidia bacterium]|jgi:guanylate kinase|nr:guanylate kinase [Bacteroidia bacterium]